jgi:hypothetical protein
MPRRALHLAERCLKMPGDASKAAGNGSAAFWLPLWRFGFPAAAQAMPGLRRSVGYGVHHGRRGSTALAKNPRVWRRASNGRTQPLQRSQPVGDDQHRARRRAEARQHAITG